MESVRVVLIINVATHMRRRGVQRARGTALA